MVFATKTVGEAMPVYDAVVIGSGYGGGVAASRLARMGLRLAVLEQGRLWRPGDFPITGKARLKALRFARPSWAILPGSTTCRSARGSPCLGRPASVADR